MTTNIPTAQDIIDAYQDPRNESEDDQPYFSDAFMDDRYSCLILGPSPDSEPGETNAGFFTQVKVETTQEEFDADFDTLEEAAAGAVATMTRLEAGLPAIMVQPCLTGRCRHRGWQPG